MSGHTPQAGGETQTQTRQTVQRPRRYKVLMHNDHYTTMDFVVGVLIEVFRKTPPEAERIMLDIHYNQVGVCGLFTAQVAETRIARVHAKAREAGFPLRCSMEPE